MNAQEVYAQIVALRGQESQAQPGQLVWVPAVENGGLRGLVEELATRGWEIVPPNKVLWATSPTDVTHSVAVLFDGGKPYLVEREGQYRYCSCHADDGRCVHRDAVDKE